MDVVPTMAMQGLQFSHKLNSQQYSINNIQPWEQLHSLKLNITCTRLLNDQLQCIKWK
jgi:hypothetical protein